MKLEKFIKIKGQIQCITGCRIGGTDTGFEIAGIDNPIIRNPLDGLPYIPGSSIKGKIRSLLEISHNKISIDKKDRANPCGCGKEDCFVCQLFGCGNSKNITAPTRLIFRDSFLNEQSRERIGEVLGDYTEAKTEVRIDRKTMTSIDPRENFRVPAGAVFDIEVVAMILDQDKKYLKEWFDKLAEGFELVESHYLGGNGTRGYGEVKFTDPDGGPLSDYIRGLDW